MYRKEKTLCNCVFWKKFHKELDAAKDPWGMINYVEVKSKICRGYHFSKSEFYEVVEAAEARKILTFMGRNREGNFYKVKPYQS